MKLSAGFVGQKIGVREVEDKIWVVSFMGYELGYFDENNCRLETINNPFAS